MFRQKIAENVLRVRERIARAAAAAGRSADEIELVAVTKYVGPREAAAVLAAGCPVLGESRLQQLVEKCEAPELADARWHLIGHLQRNKVRRILPLVEMIHSVDSLRLLEAIDRIAQETAARPRVLLEVNCSGDAEKSGLSETELLELLPQLPELEHVEVCGLMTMAARQGGQDVAARNFASLRNLRDQAMAEAPPSVVLRELSMGMSGDFEAAIREGATIVRIGSVLYEGIAT